MRARTPPMRGPAGCTGCIAPTPCVRKCMRPEHLCGHRRRVSCGIAVGAHRHAVSCRSASRCRNLLPSTETWLLLAMGLLSCAAAGLASISANTAAQFRSRLMMRCLRRLEV